MLWRSSIRNYRLALETLVVVAIIVALRALLFALGVEGLSPTALVSSIIGGGIFVMGLVIAGTLGDSLRDLAPALVHHDRGPE
jgi:hypothetical protein